MKRLNHIRDRYRELIARRRYGTTTMDIAMSFIGQPAVTAPVVSRSIGKSHTATRSALANLESRGVITPVTGTRPIVYVADDVMLAVSAAPGHVIDPDAPLIGESGGVD